MTTPTTTKAIATTDKQPCNESCKTQTHPAHETQNNFWAAKWMNFVRICFVSVIEKKIAFTFTWHFEELLTLIQWTNSDVEWNSIVSFCLRFQPSIPLLTTFLLSMVRHCLREKAYRWLRLQGAKAQSIFGSATNMYDVHSTYTNTSVWWRNFVCTYVHKIKIGTTWCIWFCGNEFVVIVFFFVNHFSFGCCLEYPIRSVFFSFKSQL